MPSTTRPEDPENGGMDVVIQRPADVAFPLAFATPQIYSAEFKVNRTTVDQFRSHIVTASEEKKSAPKTSKPKVSRLIRFSLWFNTYRFVHWHLFSGNDLSLTDQ